MWAATEGHTGTAELLLDRGADLEAKESVSLAGVTRVPWWPMRSAVVSGRGVARLPQDRPGRQGDFKLAFTERPGSGSELSGASVVLLQVRVLRSVHARIS